MRVDEGERRPEPPKISFSCNYRYVIKLCCSNKDSLSFEQSIGVILFGFIYQSRLREPYKNNTVKNIKRFKCVQIA